MSEIKKITSEEILEAATDYYTYPDVIDWHGVEIYINKTISLWDMVDFINTVVNSCFTEDGDYLPQLKDYLINEMTIMKYTNVELPDDYNVKYDLIYRTDLLAQVYAKIDASQYNSILNSIAEKISLCNQTNIESFEAKIKMVSDKLANMESLIGSLFGEINSDDINKLFSALTKNGIDETKIVDAYMNNMRESDTDGKY